MARTTPQEDGGSSSSQSPERRPLRRCNGAISVRAPTIEDQELEAAARLQSVAGRRWARGGFTSCRAPPVAHDEEENALLRSRSLVDETSSQRAKRKRGEDKEGSKNRKEAKVAGKSSASKTLHQEEEASSASAATEQASSGDSSAASSPLRCPYRPFIEVLESLGADAESVYEELTLKYREKKARHRKLVTLDEPTSYSCLLSKKFFPVRESATETVLEAGKAILGLSSYIDGKLLSRSSGFLVDWDKESNSSTILTSALLFRSKCSIDEWSGSGEYTPTAEVVVHLRDKNKTAVKAHLLHYDKHFNIALFKIDTAMSAQIPCFSTEVVYGQNAFVLGRNDDLFLNIDHGNILYQGPTTYERHYHMFISCNLMSQCGAGGPVIDFKGQVLGMAYPPFRFTPSSILLKCLHIWKKVGRIPRLHMGMKFSAIKFLHPAHVEMIVSMCNINTGLIVQEVAEGSAAEKMGIRIGDVIENLNGESVATAVELENRLLSICENHHDKGRSIGSTVDVTVGVFHIRKEFHRTKRLALQLTDDLEVFKKGIYDFSSRGGSSAFSQGLH